MESEYLCDTGILLNGLWASDTLYDPTLFSEKSLNVHGYKIKVNA